MIAPIFDMPEQLTMEALDKKIDSIMKLAEDLKSAQDKMEEHRAEDDKKHDEKRASVRKARDEAMKEAMDEKDDEKRDAAMKKAMDDYHKATNPGDHERREAAPEKEDSLEKEHVASLIKDKREGLIRQILTASRLINPAGITGIEERLKTASLRELEFEWGIVSPATQQAPIIPFMASQHGNDSEFSKLSTQDLLEGKI